MTSCFWTAPSTSRSPRSSSRTASFFLSLEDLSRIYSPDLLVQAEGGQIRLRFQKYLDTMERVQIDRQWYLREVPAEEAVLTVGEPLAQAHGEWIELSTGPREIGGILYLPAIEVMTKVFGARTVPAKNMTVLTFYEDLTFPLVLWRYYSLGCARPDVRGNSPLLLVRGGQAGHSVSHVHSHRLSAGYP